MIDGKIPVVDTGSGTMDVVWPGMEAPRCPN